MKTKETIRFYPAYFIHGPEGYLIEQEVQHLMERTLPSRERGLNLHVFQGGTHSAREIVQAAQTLPMFSTYRFVLVTDAGEMDEKDIDTIATYLQKPSPTTCLVLRAQVPGPWKRYLADLAKVGKVIEHGRLKGRELTAWIRKRMAEKGKALTEEAAGCLVETMGDHLQALDSILERISLEVGGKTTVELADVEGSASEVKMDTVFDLTEAIGRRNVDKALGLLQKAMLSKTVPFKKDEGISRMDDPVPLLLSMMARQYRSIWRVKEMVAGRAEVSEIAKELRSSPWSVNRLIDQGKHFSLSSLREGLLKCHRTDVAIKRGKGPKDLLLEKLVIDLCQPQ